LAESRTQLSEAATREEMSQLELDAATADVSSEREVSAANARRGVATDALRVEVDGAQHRAEAAQEVIGLTCARTKQGYGQLNDFLFAGSRGANKSATRCKDTEGRVSRNEAFDALELQLQLPLFRLRCSHGTCCCAG
jgi:hypothetical protein